VLGGPLPGHWQTHGSYHVLLMLLTSPDLGRSWHPLPLQPALRSQPIGLRLPGGRAWVVSGTAERTGDGGASWQPFQLPAECIPRGIGPTGDIALAAAEGVLWLKCSNIAGAGNEWRAIFRSTDGGDSWLPAGTGGFGYSGPIAAASADRAFICGNRMSLERTSDAGRTWQRGISGIDGEWFGCSLLFSDPLRGWLAVDDDRSPGRYSAAIWRTEDGGMHWQRVGLP
jgi:photosystem II stability/assembly factor-like uncharacterized protein